MTTTHSNAAIDAQQEGGTVKPQSSASRQPDPTHISPKTSGASPLAFHAIAAERLVAAVLAIVVTLWALYAWTTRLPVNDPLSAYVTEHHAAEFASRGLWRVRLRDSVAIADDRDGAHRICEGYCNPTPFDALEFSADVNGHVEVRVNVDPSLQTFDYASQEVEKAVQAAMKHYDAHARVLASWRDAASRPNGDSDSDPE